MSVHYEDAIKYPYLELVAEWAMRTNNNIIQHMGKSVLLYPIFPAEYDQLDQQIENGLPVPLEKLVVMNNSGNKEDYYTYIPNENTWLNSFNGQKFKAVFNYFNIEYDPLSHPKVPDFIYKITDNSVPPRTLGLFSVPYQVAAPSSFPEEAPSGTESADQSVLTRTRSRSGSESPQLMDRASKKSGCQGPGCTLMGGKKKTRRHKSRKQKKSKSKKHKKSKRHTRGRK